MTLLTEKGTFVKETSDSDGTPQTVSLSNGSLTPKVLWLWTTGQTSNAAYAENWSVSYGFTDGGQGCCITGASEDNEAAADTAGMFRNDSCIAILDAVTTPTTVIAQAQCTGFSAGAFDLSWDTSDPTAMIIHYMVAGGTDITNVKSLGSYNATAAAGTGTEAYTGIGFQGDFINLLIGGANSQNTTVAADWFVAIGAATSSSQRWVFGGNSEHGSLNADTYNFKDISQVFAAWDETTGNVLGLADFVSFDSDGFTLNYSDAVSANTPFAALVIKGGLWDVGSGTAPAVAGQQQINITANRDPAAVMMFTWGDTTTSSGATAEGQNRISIGGADNNLTEGCISTHDTTGSANMVNTRISLITKLIRAHTANATAGSSTTLAEADTINMSNNGNFIVDWTTTLNGMGYTWFTVSEALAAAGDTGGYGAEVFNMIPQIIDV